MSFIKSLKDFQSVIKTIKSKKISFNKKTSENLYAFKEKEHDYYINIYNQNYEALIKNSSELNSLIDIDKSNQQHILKINALLSDINESNKKNDIKKIEEALNGIIEAYIQLKLPEEELHFSIDIKNIPLQIRADFRADMEELDKCFISGCYRSAIMLCGRLL